MSIEVSWGNLEKTYVYMQVTGIWTWQEYRSGIISANELIESVDHDICIVTHLIDKDAQKLPPGAFRQWQNTLKQTPANLQLVILVPGRPLIRIFLDTIQRLFSQLMTFNFRMAATLEEAQEIVREVQNSDEQVNL